MISAQLPMCRYEFYQKPEEVVVTIFAKNLPTNSVTIEFGEQIVCVQCIYIYAIYYLHHVTANKTIRFRKSKW